MFSSIPVNKDIYDDLDRYRFIGWVTQNSFVGVFSHPLIKPKSDLPKWFNAAIVENRAIKVNLPEIKTPFSNFSNKKKLGFSIEGSTLDSLTIYYSVTLPEGIPKLRQNVLEELLEQKRKYNIPVEDVLETHVLDYMKKESRIVSAFMKNRNVEYNSILFYYNIELPYVDSNLICFRSVKNTSYSPSRSTSSRSYIVEDTTKYLNYNIKTKEFIKVEDIFLDGSSEIIGKIVENSDDMRKFKSDETDLAFAMKPFDIKAFFLTSKGISFEFPPTPNYRSEVYIFVPYGDLSKYLKPNFKKKIAQW